MHSYGGYCIVMRVLTVQAEYRLWGKNVLVPGCSGGRCSVAPTRGQQLKERVGWVCHLCCFLQFLISHRDTEEFKP